MMNAALPDSFRAPKRLRQLNIVAVAFSLAAATGAAFLVVFGGPRGSTWHPAVVSALSTLVYGVFWARMVRSRKGGVPVGWLVAAPFAAMNAGTACMLLSLDNSGSHENLVASFFLGATLGGIIWVPALVLTLLFFGVPLYYAQRAADKGLGSEDRGERVVGLAAVAWSLVSFLGLGAEHQQLSSFQVSVLAMLGTIGVLAGVASTVYATGRENARRRFLRQASSGEASGYRVVEIAQQPVLVAVTRTGEAYRAADLATPLAELDADGDARRILEA